MAVRDPATDNTPTGRQAAPTKKQTAGSSAADSGGGYTARSWAKELLHRLGFPETTANVSAIVSWEAAEGGHWNNTAYFNPLNTTQDAPGATAMNDVGVKAYTSSWSGSSMVKCPSATTGSSCRSAISRR